MCAFIDFKEKCGYNFPMDRRKAMYNKALETIKKYNMIAKGDKIVVGLSGGPDSCALVHLLSCLKNKYELTVVAVHVHHGIRGTEADRDEQFVRKFCEELGIELFVYHFNIPKEAKKRGLGEEETGRIIRYEMFNETLKKINADKIAVAHNLNDRSETFIMNLCRGSGLKGLAGIQAVNGNIIRPLIDCSRNDIEKYCDENRIYYCTDSTNSENDYTRNKIRNILLPWLKENVNSGADLNIAAASEIIREEEEFLESMADEVYKRAIISENNDFISLKFDKLSCENAVIRRRVLRKALRCMRPDLRDFSKKHIEEADSILLGRTGRKNSLPGGITVRKNYNNFEIFKESEKINKFCYELKIGKTYFIKEIGKNIMLSFEAEKNMHKSLNVCTKKADYDKIRGKIKLRTRQAGDTIGIKMGRKKLKDLFIDEKIPADKRDSIPVLACGNSIVLVGDRLGHDYYVSEETKNVLYIYIWEDC